jgi:hypothetical protein
MISTAAVAAALLAMPAPGFAAVDTIFGTNPVLDNLCNDQLNPNDNSDFTTYAIVTGTPVITSVTVDNGPTTYAGIGPSTTVLTYRNAHVNGQSVNIHAYGDRVTSHVGGATATTPTKTTVTTTVNAGCHVHKPTNGNSPSDTLHQDYMSPPGLQLNPVSSSSTDITYGTRSETLAGPWIDPNATAYNIEFVICISPTKNPGVWRGQNGYISQLGRTCSTAWHDSLGLSVSNSLPPL